MIDSKQQNKDWKKMMIGFAVGMIIFIVPLFYAVFFCCKFDLIQIMLVSLIGLLVGIISVILFVRRYPENAS